MIQFSTLKITSLDSYNLLREHIKSSQHIDDYTIRELKDHIGCRCKVIGIEYPYFESDYLSNYYIFYSKKLQDFPKECYRLLFFADENRTELMGYITLRPTYQRTRIGRTYIEPQYLIDDPDARVLTTNFKIHFRASEATLKAFPWMHQEGDVAVCAHVAAWSVLRYLSTKFRNYQEKLLANIVDAVRLSAERKIPSIGLTVDQISDVFLQAGLSPIIRKRESHASEEMDDELLSYIESGIPFIGVIPSREHAIAVIGHGKRIAQGINVENVFQDSQRVVYSSKFISDIIVNDDRHFPYSTIPKILGEQKTGYTFRAISCAVVPLYQKVHITYADVRIQFENLVKANDYDWPEKMVARIFLSSSNTYREYTHIQKKEAISSDLKSLIIGLELPKLIWCIEISSINSFQEGIVDSIIIIDSTSATVNNDPFLFILDGKTIKYKSAGEKLAIERLDDSVFSVPYFDSNLWRISNGEN